MKKFAAFWLILCLLLPVCAGGEISINADDEDEEETVFP